LSIDVGDAEIIEVDEGELADPAARKRFRSPGTHSADSDDGHVGPAKPPKGTFAIESGDSGKALERVVAHGGDLIR